MRWVRSSAPDKGKQLKLADLLWDKLFFRELADVKSDFCDDLVECVVDNPPIDTSSNHGNVHESDTNVSSLEKRVKVGKNIECQLVSYPVKQTSRIDNFKQVSDERVLHVAVEKSPKKFDARVNVKTRLCVDESVKRRGISLNGDMEVSFASGKQDAPTQMCVFSNAEELETELR
ncbi:hypothetical protein HAX54_022426 [Datura stramonium]|uniref:Uncharacterized protein n=1 Tax=Datura stramonium TaxID=4076 RepID=A0ABS8S489_DATST|nr:hypothetical protein [Datura stramonium]